MKLGIHSYVTLPKKPTAETRDLSDGTDCRRPLACLSKDRKTELKSPNSRREVLLVFLLPFGLQTLQMLHVMVGISQLRAAGSCIKEEYFIAFFLFLKEGGHVILRDNWTRSDILYEFFLWSYLISTKTKNIRAVSRKIQSDYK